MRLFAFPSFKALAEVHHPGHQLVAPMLSPDGTRLSCMANRLHGNRESVALFDTASRTLLAESKADFFSVSEYLPNHRTVVLPKSGFMEGEPIRFWTPSSRA
ncbi:MAG: hypothetical protein AAF492_14525 [Verrucomicrobiota bacterium]